MDVQRVVEILCRYRHQTLGEEEIEIIPDLQLVNVFAARVQGRVEYVVRADEGSVEEVAFEGWPPIQPGLGRAGDGRPEPEGRDSGSAAYAAARASSAEESPAAAAEPAPTPAPGSEPAPEPEPAPTAAAELAASGAMTPRVERFMSRPVYLCDADATLADAARLMWELDCGCLPVSSADDDGVERLVGIVTDRDICMAALLSGLPLSGLRVADLIDGPPASVSPSDSIAAAAQVMSEAQVRRLPVVDEEGRLAGFLSLADLALASQGDHFVDPDLVGCTLGAISRPRARDA